MTESTVTPESTTTTVSSANNLSTITVDPNEVNVNVSSISIPADTILVESSDTHAATLNNSSDENVIKPLTEEELLSKSKEDLEKYIADVKALSETVITNAKQAIEVKKQEAKDAAKGAIDELNKIPSELEKVKESLLAKLAPYHRSFNTLLAIIILAKLFNLI